MPNYQKGLIYKLCCKDFNVKEIYVGSSTNMYERLRTHKVDYKRTNPRVYNYIRENGGWDNWSIIWIKDFPCNSKKELEAEEDKIMRELKASLNSKQSTLSDEERILKEKKYKNDWYIRNKEKQSIKYKETYIKNKESIREKRKEKITCACGSIIIRFGMSRHIKTKKHLDLISS